MRSLLLSLLCIAASHCGAPASPTTPTDTPTSLVSLVARGSYVVFFRHTERDASAISIEELQIVDRRGDCVAGSELTARGVADAVAIGAAFRRLAIRVERVYASPTCRTQQMAYLAFGEHETTSGLAWPDVWTEEESGTLGQVLPRLLGMSLAPGRTRVLISHSGLLVPTRIGLDIMLDQGEAAVFRPAANASFEFVGKIPKANWLRDD